MLSWNEHIKFKSLLVLIVANLPAIRNSLRIEFQLSISMDQISQKSRNAESHLKGPDSAFVPEFHGNEIAWNDSKIAYVTKICQSKTVLDLGCVQHDIRFVDNKYWLHKAIREVAASVVGLDLYSEGVKELNNRGFDVVHGDAQDFDLNTLFDVIIAGDLIEHLSSFQGFFDSCVAHMHQSSKLVICTPNPWHWHKVLRAIRGYVPVNKEHTCWMCPTTLKQLASRHGLRISNVVYGSSRWKDSCVPAPPSIRHSSWYATLQRE